MFKEHSLIKIDFNEYQNILDLRSKKNGQKFFKEPASDRTGNSEKSNGPLGVGQWLGGILSKK